MLDKECITLTLGMAKLGNRYLPIIRHDALDTALFRCARRNGMIAKPAGVEVVFLIAPRVAKELLSQRPDFQANLTLPSQLVHFARIYLRTPTPKRLAPGCAFLCAADLLSGALLPPVRLKLHAHRFCRLQPDFAPASKNPITSDNRPALERSFLIPLISDVGGGVARRMRTDKISESYALFGRGFRRGSHALRAPKIDPTASFEDTLDTRRRASQSGRDHRNRHSVAAHLQYY